MEPPIVIASSHRSLMRLAVVAGLALFLVAGPAIASTTTSPECTALQGALLQRDWTTAQRCTSSLLQKDPKARCRLGIPALQRLTERSLQIRTTHGVSEDTEAGDGRGVGEFMTYMTAYGLASGLMLNATLNVNDGRAVVAIPMVTTAAAFVGAWQLGKRWRYSAAESSIITSGVAWGMFYTLMIQGMADLNDDHMPTRLLLGELAGGAAGYALTSLGLSRAAIAAASSGGAWGAIIGGFFVLAADPQSSALTFGPSTMLSLGGLALGAHLGSSGMLTRQQWALVDVGGAVGTVAGLGIGALAGDEKVTGVAASVGAVVGLCVAAVSLSKESQPAASSASHAVRLRPTMLQVGHDATNRAVFGPGLVVDQW